MKIYKRYKEYYASYGFAKTLTKIISKPLRILNKYIAYKNFYNLKKTIFAQNSIKDKFSYIYSSHYWPSKESVSGPGSELENTKNVRKELVKLIDQLKIKKFLDIPCGDFNWMQHIINKDIEYVGGDIVTELIDLNKKKFINSNIKFIELNIIEDKLPQADLMLCRDCLIHLSNNNIKKFLNNFINSEINYLLVTSYEANLDKKSIGYNSEIKDGDFRPTFLMEEPFKLPVPITKILDKDVEHRNNTNLKCYLYLYSKNQLKVID